MPKMNAFAKILDKFDIASEIRFERAVHKGAFLVVEGDTDMKRFQPLMDEIACSLINARGRDNAIGATEILTEERFEGVLACVDADFDRLLKAIDPHENILYSRHHDFDMDWLRTENIKKYLGEVADPVKLASAGGSTSIISQIKLGLLPISFTRLANHSKQFRHKVNHVDAGRCITGLQIDYDIYFNLLMEQRNPPTGKKEVLRAIIEKYKAQYSDLDQLTNGHDFHCVLGAALQIALGDRRSQQAWGKEVEMHLRLAYTDAQFMQTDLFQAIRVWEFDNDPYLVLASQLQPSAVKSPPSAPDKDTGSD